MPKNKSPSYTLILLLILILNITSYTSTDIELTVWILITISSLIIITSYLLENDWKSPNVLLTLVATMYSLVFPIYFLLGGELIGSLRTTSILTSIKLSNLFISSLYIGGILVRARYNMRPIYKYTETKLNDSIVEIFLYIFLILYSLSFVQVLTSGITSKADRMSENTATFATFFGGIYFCIGYLASKKWIRGETLRRQIIIVITTAIVGYGILEERDELILPIIFLLLIRSYYIPIKVRTIVIIGLFTITVFTLLGYSRSYSLGENSIESYSILYLLQDNEFIFAGRNLAYVIENVDIKLNGLTFIGDILHPFFISEFPTGTTWFNLNHYENKGLSLIAESYMNFGELGVSLTALVCGAILNWSYIKSKRGNISAVFYSLLIISSMYAYRSDFAAITSAAVRKFLIPYICIIIATNLLRNSISNIYLKTNKINHYISNKN